MNRIALNNFYTIDIQADFDLYLTCTIQHKKTGNTFKIRILPPVFEEQARFVRTNIIMPNRMLTSYILYKSPLPHALWFFTSEELHLFDRKFVRECFLQAHFSNVTIWNGVITEAFDAQIFRRFAQIRLPHLDLELNHAKCKPMLDVEKLHKWQNENGAVDIKK